MLNLNSRSQGMVDQPQIVTGNAKAEEKTGLHEKGSNVGNHFAAESLQGQSLDAAVGAGTSGDRAEHNLSHQSGTKRQSEELRNDITGTDDKRSRIGEFPSVKADGQGVNPARENVASQAGQGATLSVSNAQTPHQGMVPGGLSISQGAVRGNQLNPSEAIANSSAAVGEGSKESIHESVQRQQLVGENNMQGQILPASVGHMQGHVPGQLPLAVGQQQLTQQQIAPLARANVMQPQAPPGSTLQPAPGTNALQLQMLQRGPVQPGISESDAAAFAARNRIMLAQFPMAGGMAVNPLFAQLNRQRLESMQSFLPAPAPRSQGISLALSCDDEQLSEYQMLVRKQLEIFEAQQEDVESNTQGRKKQVVLGQVGIRCRHCAGYPLRQRGRGAVYYPAKLQGVYQAAQNMASSHLCESCQVIPAVLKQELRTLRERRDTASGGKQYWADGARAMGLYETDEGLKLRRTAGS